MKTEMGKFDKGSKPSLTGLGSSVEADERPTTLRSTRGTVRYQWWGGASLIAVGDVAEQRPPITPLNPKGATPISQKDQKHGGLYPPKPSSTKRPKRGERKPPQTPLPPKTTKPTNPQKTKKMYIKTPWFGG